RGMTALIVFGQEEPQGEDGEGGAEHAGEEPPPRGVQNAHAESDRTGNQGVAIHWGRTRSIVAVAGALGGDVFALDPDLPPAGRDRDVPVLGVGERGRRVKPDEPAGGRVEDGPGQLVRVAGPLSRDPDPGKGSAALVDGGGRAAGRGGGDQEDVSLADHGGTPSWFGGVSPAKAGASAPARAGAFGPGRHASTAGAYAAGAIAK